MLGKHFGSCYFLGWELMHFQLLNGLARHISNVVHRSAYKKKNPSLDGMGVERKMDCILLEKRDLITVWPHLFGPL